MLTINLGLTAIATGTVDAITATYTPAPTLVDKKVLFLRTIGTNTIVNPTFAPNGLTAHTITKNNGDALAVGDLDGDVILMYDLANTRWEVLNPKVSGGTQTLAQVLTTGAAFSGTAMTSPNGASTFLMANALSQLVASTFIQLNSPTFDWNSDSGAYLQGWITGQTTSLWMGYGDEALRFVNAGVTLEGTGITASRAVYLDASSTFKTSATTSTELGYLSGVTSAIQTQLGLKAATANVQQVEVMTGSLAVFSPSDSSTTYIGCSTPLTPSATNTTRQFQLPVGTVKSAWLYVDIANTLASNENVTYYLHNITTATSTIIGTLTYDTRGNAKLVTGLSIAIANATDYYSVEIVNPAFATNPTNCYTICKLVIYP